MGRHLFFPTLSPGNKKNYASTKDKVHAQHQDRMKRELNTETTKPALMALMKVIKIFIDELLNVKNDVATWCHLTLFRLH